MSSDSEKWNNYQIYINNLPNNTKPLSQNSYDIFKNMFNSLNNITVTEFNHIQYKLTVSDNDNFSVLLGNDSNDYVFSIGIYSFINIKYSNGNNYYYILKENNNNSEIVYHYGEPMYIENSEFEIIGNAFKFKAGVYYGLEDGNIYELKNVSDPFTFRDDIYYGFYNGNVYELGNNSYTFKAGIYYGLEDGNVHQLNNSLQFIFKAGIYYGLEDGNIHQLEDSETQFLFEAGVYYGAENGNIHRLYDYFVLEWNNYLKYKHTLDSNRYLTESAHTLLQNTIQNNISNENDIIEYTHTGDSSNYENIIGFSFNIGNDESSYTIDANTTFIKVDNNGDKRYYIIKNSSNLTYELVLNNDNSIKYLTENEFNKLLTLLDSEWVSYAKYLDSISNINIKPLLETDFTIIKNQILSDINNIQVVSFEHLDFVLNVNIFSILCLFSICGSFSPFYIYSLTYAYSVPFL